MTTVRTTRSAQDSGGRQMPWRFLLSVFVLSKAVATMLGMVALWAAANVAGGSGHYKGNHVGPISMWFQWDSQWYEQMASDRWTAPLSSSARTFIAQAQTDPSFHGKVSEELHFFSFPPLFPLLAKVLSTVLFGHVVLAMVIIVNLAFAGCLVLMHAIGRDIFGDEQGARWSVVAFAALPMSFLFQAAATESLFLFLLLGTLWSASHERWAWAAVLGFLAALTRSTGFVLAVPVLVEALRHARRRDLRAFVLATPAVMAPVAGWCTFLLWCRWRTGDLLAYNHLQRAGWDVGLSSPARVVKDAFAHDAPSMYRVKLAAIVLVLLALLLGSLMLPPAHLVLGAMLVLLPISIGAHWDDSILRYLAVVYPVALVAVAAARRRPVVAPYLVVCGAAFQACFLLIWCWSFTFQII